MTHKASTYQLSPNHRRNKRYFIACFRLLLVLTALLSLCPALESQNKTAHLEFHQIDLPPSIQSQGITDFSFHPRGLLYYISGNQVIQYDGGDHLLIHTFAGHAPLGIACHQDFLLTHDGQTTTFLGLQKPAIIPMHHIPPWKDALLLGDSLVLLSPEVLTLCAADSQSHLGFRQKTIPKRNHGLLYLADGLHILYPPDASIDSSSVYPYRALHLSSTLTPHLPLENNLNASDLRNLDLNRDFSQIQQLLYFHGQWLQDPSPTLDGDSQELNPLSGMEIHKVRYFHNIPWILTEQGLYYLYYPTVDVSPEAILCAQGDYLVKESSQRYRLHHADGELWIDLPDSPSHQRMIGDNLLLASKEKGIFSTDGERSTRWLGSVPDGLLDLTLWRDELIMATTSGIITSNPQGSNYPVISNIEHLEASDAYLCLGSPDSVYCHDSLGVIILRTPHDGHWYLRQNIVTTLERDKMICHSLDQSTNPREVYRQEQNVSNFYLLPDHYLIVDGTQWRLISKRRSTSQPLQPPEGFAIKQQHAGSPWLLTADGRLIHAGTLELIYRQPEAYILPQSQVSHSAHTQQLYLSGLPATVRLQGAAVAPFGQKNTQYRWRNNKSESTPWNSSPFFEISTQDLETIALQVRTESTTSEWAEYHVALETRKNTTLTWYWTLGGLLLLATALGLYLHFLNQERKRKHLRHRKLKIQERIKRLEQSVRQSQMNPHFIFNGLESIRQNLRKQDITLTETLVMDFADLTRKVLHYGELKSITLEEEIEFLRTYVNLQSKIQGLQLSPLQIEGDVLDEASLIHIPPLCLQPFVENALLHGIRPLDATGSITIRFVEVHQLLHCFIEDNGVGLQNSGDRQGERSHAGRATDILRDRLSHYSPLPVQYESPIADGRGTRVKVVLPIFAG